MARELLLSWTRLPQNTRAVCLRRTSPDNARILAPLESLATLADNSGEWCGNGLRFATREEAEGNARDLMNRWTLVRETRATESSDPVNYQWIEYRLIPVD